MRPLLVWVYVFTFVLYEAKEFYTHMMIVAGYSYSKFDWGVSMKYEFLAKLWVCL